MVQSEICGKGDLARRRKCYFNQHQAEKALYATFAFLFLGTLLIRGKSKPEEPFLTPGQEEEVPAARHSEKGKERVSTGVSKTMGAAALTGRVISLLLNDVNIPASKAVININVSLLNW